MSRRDDTKAETRRMILSAARGLLRRSGAEAATMRAVAKEAGVSAAAVVLHFRGRAGLLEAAITEDIQRAISGALATMPEGAPLIDRLMHLPGALYRFYATDRALYRELVRSTVFEPEEDNILVSAQLGEYLRFTSTMISADKRTGRVRLNADAEVAAAALASMYIGVLIRFFRNTAMTAQDASAMLRAMTEQFMRGLLTKEA